MSRIPPGCRAIEPDLVAIAVGEGSAAAAVAVVGHLEQCVPCRETFERYRAVEALVAELRRVPGPDPMAARAELESRLVDLRRRRLAVGVFASPLGPVLLARSEEGVVAVEYLQAPTLASSRLARATGAELVEDRATTEGLFADLLDYLEGRRTRLDWPLDLRRVRGEFHRRVLQAAAALPYGAVTSYAGLAARVGVPQAPRAVAQALRHNPLPIVIPCHRVVGSDGDLTGYAGDRLDLKRRLLGVEGVPIEGGRRRPAVERRAMYVRPFEDSEYCLPTCESVGRRPLRELVLFGSRRAAEAAGLAPCRTCRPDLHPLRP